MDKQGCIVQGTLVANNINELEMQLERMELDIIHYRLNKSHHYLRLRIEKVSRRDLISFCFQMENLTRAGVPLLDGLGDLRDSLPQSRFREIVSSLIESIEAGASLSVAMAKFPESFSQIFISLIETGEKTGELSLVFQHLAETLKWQDEMVAKTKKLLMYPAFMGVVIVGVLFFVMMYLVPQLISFIKNIGGELPLHTQILIFVSNLFVQYWLLILIVPVLAFLAVKLALQSSYRFRFVVDGLKLRFWIIGPIIEKIIFARFATFFALLYKSGITVLESLALCKTLTGNLVIEKALEQIGENIAEGCSISNSFEQANLFPPLLLRMIQVGESTGELDIALSNVSYFYNREVKEAIEQIQTLIEPVMTVILGLLLAWVILSVLGPIYEVISGFSY